MSKWVLASAAIMLLSSSTLGFAQESADGWASPPLHVRAHRHLFEGNGRCSLDQRDYAYINECGELVPSTWDAIPGRG